MVRFGFATDPFRSDLKRVRCLYFQNGLHRTQCGLQWTLLWTFKFIQTHYGSDEVCAGALDESARFHNESLRRTRYQLR